MRTRWQKALTDIVRKKCIKGGCLPMARGKNVNYLISLEFRYYFFLVSNNIHNQVKTFPTE